MKDQWSCRKCGVKLIEKKVVFEYLENNFTADMLQCPSCGNVLIPEDIAKGKMAEVEKLLEEK